MKKIILNTRSILSTQATNNASPPRPPPPEIPKSPPKWPLRPGVLVHLKSDTKQNLCATRAQSPNSSTLTNANNVSYTSPLLNSRNASVVSEVQARPPDLPARNPHTKTNAMTRSAGDGGEHSLVNRNNESAVCGELKTNKNTDITMNNENSAVDPNADVETNSPVLNINNDELYRFTSSSFINRILRRMRWRRKNTLDNKTDEQYSPNDDGIFSKSNRRAVNLLRATGWFGSGKSTNSSTGLMSEQKHHLRGLTYSDGGKYTLHVDTDKEKTSKQLETHSMIIDHS